MRIEVSSKNNETVKNVRKLLNSAKFRNSQKKFVIEGTRLCEEAVKSNVEVTQIFYTQKCFQKFSDLGLTCQLLRLPYIFSAAAAAIFLRSAWICAFLLRMC